jgi:hypothetical protein
MAFRVKDQMFDPLAEYGMAGDPRPIGYWAVTGLSVRDDLHPFAQVNNPRLYGPPRPCPGTNLGWLAVVTVAVTAWLTKEARAAGAKPVRAGACEVVGAAAKAAADRIKAGENATAVAYELFTEAVAGASGGPLAEFKGMVRVD